ncbi:hypothetical protein SPI_05506 [Niveomyces insectorum RCEF 264]|uniref:Aminoglycoside phosphotransferase n=1 Tax=Niveomyces insectorum RCEF 264 TaxID=1081102 RepID=A0A167TA86_9HYPO|nr:hypothetical protein SPI_05506 [Niveomyces insectorum RCEF 264]
MASTIQLGFVKHIDYDAAVASEDDVLNKHRQWKESMAFLVDLWQRRQALERLVALHLRVDDAARVRTGHPKTWRQGAFNEAIPMLVFDDAAAAHDQTRFPAGPDDGETGLRRVILRCPLPAKCAETYHPGSILEKMRCETAAYVWMQRHCPGARIPHLYGFGFPNGAHFVASLLRWPVPSDYLPIDVHDAAVTAVPTGYMVLEHFGPSLGKEMPLVIRNQKLTEEPVKMHNLFRSVSRVLLAVARIPQPRIGAFRFNDDGTISLDNRPITCGVFLLENDGAPRTMAIDRTYTNVDQYVADLATFHDQRFLAAPNAALDLPDCHGQMAIKTCLRAVAHHFLKDEHRSGPFALYLSDANAANFMVDDDWNVTGMFDLEWIISGPVDLPRTPSWLTWESIDAIAGKGYAEFDATRAVFMKVFKEEERRTDTGALEDAAGSTLSSIMEDTWRSKRFWFYKSLLSTNGMDHIVRSQIIPLFSQETLAYTDVARLWCPALADVVKRKLDDRAAYLVELADLFGRTT